MRQIDFPTEHVGAFIGKAGEVINEIRRLSNSDVQVVETGGKYAKISICGDCDLAHRLIIDKMSEKGIILPESCAPQMPDPKMGMATVNPGNLRMNVLQVLHQATLPGLDGAAAKIAQTLAAVPTDTRLRLDNQNLGPEAAQVMGRVLMMNNTLRELSIGFNAIGDMGASGIAEGLKMNQTITELHLSCNQIGDAGAQAIAQALLSNRSISWIALNDNQIGAAGSSAIGEVLKNNQTLRDLLLFGNHVGDAGAAAIAEGLRGNNTIAKLVLNENHIGDHGASALAHCISNNRMCTQLHLFLNPMGTPGRNALRSAWAMGGRSADDLRL